MGKTAFLFPGQGAQAVGMGKDFHDAFPASRQVYAQASDILGWDVAAACFSGPAAELNRTSVCQPAILTTSLAVVAAMREAGLSLVNEASAAAGLSLGEYTALVFAGALTLEQALPLVRKRGELMDAACAANPGGMASVIGMAEDALNAVCAEAAQGQVLSPANYNSPEQIVISGHREAVQRAAALAEQRGAKRAIPLQVAGAFHSALMASAAQGLIAVLKDTPIAAPRIDVVPNVTAAPTRDSAEIRRLLGLQVDHPVRWSQSVQRLAADGFDRFVEVAPGKVLTGLLRRISPSAQAVNISAAAQLQELIGNTSKGGNAS